MQAMLATQYSFTNGRRRLWEKAAPSLFAFYSTPFGKCKTAKTVFSTIVDTSI